MQQRAQSKTLPEEQKVSRIQRDNLRKKNREFVYNHLQNKKCADCKKTYHPAALDFDHVKGNKVGNISQMTSDGYSLESIKQEIEKCEIRCANCHRIKTARTHNWYKNIRGGG